MSSGTRKQQQILRDALADLPDNFVDCRDPGLRHQWVLITPFHTLPGKTLGRRLMQVGRTSQCSRCSTTKAEVFAVHAGDTVEKIGVTYTYPDGYKIPGVPRGVKQSSVIWAEQLSRTTARTVTRAARLKAV